MKFEVTSRLAYTVYWPSTIILNVHALRNSSQTVLEESLILDPSISVEELVSPLGENRYIRLETGDRKNIEINYCAIVDLKTSFIDKSNLEQVPVVKLDREIIPYLFPSRYCQSDRLSRLANDKFGAIDHPYDKVIAITEWIYKNVEYVSGSTNSETSAFDTVTQRVGVCRDFAHLAISLCRASSIPARYFGCYSFKLNPPDFHACFEAYLGNHWVIFDATKLAPLNGLIRISTGRDAADAAVATIFGNTRLDYQSVNCNSLEDTFESVFLNQLQDRGFSLD